jgi:TPP-dependent indolepyruvate ferredoxin oxidoreductase alpha subunit
MISCIKTSRQNKEFKYYPMQLENCDNDRKCHKIHKCQPIQPKTMLSVVTVDNQQTIHITACMQC